MKVNPLKRLGSFLVALVMSLSVLAPTAFAVEGDMGGNGGSMGSGSHENKWVQVQGVRLTAIDATNGNPVSQSIDWVNDKNGSPWSSAGRTEDDLIHFGKYYKRSYTIESTLDKYIGGYDYYTPPDDFPTIIKIGSSNIAAIRDYFIDETAVKCFCADVYELSSGGEVVEGTPAGDLYDSFTLGKYDLAIEPLVFMIWDGVLYGGTVTEIALLAKGKGKSVCTGVATLTHRSAPDSLFLEERHEELQYPSLKPPYELQLDQSSKYYYKNDTIIDSCLGIGIVWFAPPNTPDPTPTVYHHIYNLRINAPKGATFTTGGQTIPLTASNIAKILNGETITVDGTAVKLSLSMLTDLLRYCMNNGYISNGSGQTLGDGNWDEVIPCQLDKSASNSGFSKDAAGNLIYKVSEDDKFAAQMSSRGVPYLILSSEVTEAVGADNKIYPGPETGNKDIVHYRYGASTGDFFTNAYAEKVGTNFPTVEISWTTVLNRMLAALANYDGTPGSATLGKCMFSDGGLWEAQTGEEYHTATFTITAEEEPTDIYYHTATYTVQLKDGDSTPTSLSQIKTLVGSPVWTVEKKTIDANTDKYNPALDGNLTGINCNANMGSQFFLGNDLQ